MLENVDEVFSPQHFARAAARLAPSARSTFVRRPRGIQPHGVWSSLDLPALRLTQDAST